MRTIKFRAWELGKMIQWEDFDRLLKNPSIIPTKLFEGQDTIKLMQFTGLSDKNGKEIYEGDIVSWKPTRGELISTIAWSDENGGWVALHSPTEGKKVDQMYMDNFEVIGNIHENKDLL